MIRIGRSASGGGVTGDVNSYPSNLGFECNMGCWDDIT
jgi:hypothetical protein